MSDAGSGAPAGDPSADPVAAARADGRTTLTEAEAKSLLAEAGVETTEFAVAADPESAADAAADLGFPVVLKVSSPAVTHKSEWADGAGVALGLDSSEAVAAAAERVFDAAEDEGIDAAVLVEEARDVDAGTEVIVGGLRDPSFGPVVLTGLGGVFTEVYEDTSHRLAPLDRAEAREAVEELTAARLLSGYRGRPAADVDALADVVCAVGDLLVEREAVAQVDVNPVLSTDDGAVALDALVVLDGGAGDE
ncbi:acetate--CoA ligase family protein [Halorarum halobium]|uniref:acetate--CoA ligase family protein n=1 Tax=Halorarum halobium TaxID=3075121 RepID=UPI0028A8FE78|nr:acetate--CoA ligase family protein [Halobaculum sp. XH14]